MGIFDGLFTSAADEAKIKRARQRRATRAVERVIENLQDKSKSLERERTKLWNTAREQMISGQKSAASSTLKIYKSKLVMGERVEKQLLLSQHHLDSITTASDMQQISGALAELATVMNVDPDVVQDSIDSLDDKSADVQDVVKIMDQAFARDMARLDRDAEQDEAESEDALMTALMNEVNGSLVVPGSLGSVAEESAPVNTNAAAADDINAGRDTLKKLLDGNK
ncbi:MAG: hypothetical protein J6S54_02980 [Lentisphaeria bacterium]|nr:hypothetical protein [Lentisphaeria bacterium]